MASPGTNAWAIEHYGQPGSHGQLVTFEFYPGVRITVDGRARDAFAALGRVMESFGYKVRRADTGAYNKRFIKGTRIYSNHSWGLAVDVNWNSNPFSSKLITDMPPEMIDAILGIHTGNGKRVFRWGGHYSRKKDAMHFEVMVTPADIASGVRVPDSIGKSRGGTDSGEDDMITQGSTGPYVAQVQRLINGVNYRSFQKKVFDEQIPSLRVDGVWGPASQDAFAHAVLRATAVNKIDFAKDVEISTVTPALVAHLLNAVQLLGAMD